MCMKYLVTVKLTVRAFRDGTLTSPQGTPADTEEKRERGREGREREQLQGASGKPFLGAATFTFFQIEYKREQGRVVFILPLLLKG